MAQRAAFTASYLEDLKLDVVEEGGLVGRLKHTPRKTMDVLGLGLTGRQ